MQETKTGAFARTKGRGPRWFGTFMVVFALAAGGFPGIAPAQQAQTLPSGSAPAPQMPRFDIPSQSLTDGLTLFGRQSGWQVSVHGDLVRGLSTPGVSGLMTPEQALGRLLAGTGLTYAITSGNTVTLQKLPQTGQADPNVIQLNPLQVEGQGDARNRETALGPVNGYIASRSATGTKTDTPLIETPQSITVVTRDQIIAQNPQSVPQALRYAPGIEAESRGNIAGSADIIYGRGFIMDRYLNGLKLQGGSGYITPQIDVYNLERIEVLRGPASVLYGAASPGGLVNLVSKMPTTSPHYDLFLQGGSIDNFAGGFDIGGPVGDGDKLFYRLTGVGRTADNQVDFNKTQRLSISPALTWKPDTDTSITLMLNYQYDPYVGLYNFIPAIGSVLPNPNGSIPRGFYAGDPNFNQYSRNQFSVGYLAERRMSDVFTVRQNFRYMYSGGQLDQVLAYSLDGDGQTLNRYNASVKEDVRTVSVDTQLQSTFATGPLQHRLLTGFDYQSNSFNQELSMGFDVPPINIFAPVYHVTVGSTDLVSKTNQNQNQLGLYAQDQIRLGKWSFLLGLRQDWANSNTIDQVALTSTLQSDSKLTWRAGLVYLFDNGIAPYASYSTSFQPTLGVTASGSPFKPTTAEQFEVGIKYQPRGLKSFFMASLYQITEQNVLTTDPSNILFQTQTGEIRSNGIELSATIVPVDGLNIIAAYSYNNPIITRSNDNDVNHMPAFVPNNTASLWGDYTFQKGALKGFQFGGGVRYVGFTYSDSSNTLQVPAYTLVDAMIAYDLGAISPKLEGLSAALNATNIFNTQYVSECSNATNCLYGQGTTVLATIRKKF